MSRPLESAPESPEAAALALFANAAAHLDAGATDAALSCLEQAAALCPDLPEVHANLGITLDGAGRWAEAESAYRACLALDPTFDEVHLNLAALCLRQKRLGEAHAVYLQVLSQDPLSAHAWTGMGVVLACVHKETEAEMCHRRAVELEPGHRNARFNLAYLLLRQGRMTEGWEHLEARAWRPGLPGENAPPCWMGQPLSGKSMLLIAEAGHGDAIHFARGAALLKARGAARIVLVTQPALKRVLSTLKDVDDVVAPEEPLALNTFDFFAPAMSVPLHCGVTLESIPGQVPYLFAEPANVAAWSSRLDTLLPERAAPALRVGLVWRGNPKFENDADRSLPGLPSLAPLWDVPGVSFVSLQKGAGEDEAGRADPAQPLLALGPHLHDFADTAAVLAQLDLVISVDTAVAHLAGALGRPVWVLLPDYKTDWRWLTERQDSPWYPTVMRLFRQDSTQQWGPTIARVAEALGRFAATHPGRGSTAPRPR